MSVLVTSCTPRGYEVTLARAVSMREIIQQVYGVRGLSEANALAATIRGMNPRVAYQVRDLSSTLPVGTRLLLPTPGFGSSAAEPEFDAVRQAIRDVQRHVDSIHALKGSGIVLVLPRTEPLVLRSATEVHGLQTWVRVTPDLPVPAPAAPPSWWDKYGGVVLSCGAATAGAAAAALSCGATPFTAGASAPVCVASWVGTAASGAQCGLSIATVSSSEFSEYLQTEDGQWINYVDIGLDFLSLGVGVASLPNAFKAGSNVYKLSKYSKYLSQVNKSKLTKTMAQLEKLVADMPELRAMFEKGLKLSNPAGRTTLTNNIIRRMLPHVRYDLNRRQVENLSALVGAALSAAGSNAGGVGSEGWGVVKNVRLEIYQFMSAGD